MVFNKMPAMTIKGLGARFRAGASLTCGWVDAGSDVKMAESVGVGQAALLVVVVSTLKVRQAAGPGELRYVLIGGVLRFVKIPLSRKTRRNYY